MGLAFCWVVGFTGFCGAKFFTIVAGVLVGDSGAQEDIIDINKRSAATIANQFLFMGFKSACTIINNFDENNNYHSA